MQCVRVRIRVRVRAKERVRVRVSVRVRARVKVMVMVRVSVSCAFSEAFVGIAVVRIAAVGIAACTPWKDILPHRPTYDSPHGRC